MVTATSDMLHELEMAFNNVSSTTFADSGAAFQIAESKMNAANALNYRGASFAEAKKAARLYGQCAAIGISNDSTELESDAKSRFAQLLAHVVVPNRDEARVRASELFRKLGDEVNRKERDRAAMWWTNSAVVILEMNNPTSEQLDAAHTLLEKTLRIRGKGTVDAGYGQMNLALAELKVSHRLATDQRRATYRRILKALDRSARTFEKHEGSHYAPSYHSIVLDTLIDWLEFELAQSEEALYARCLPGDLYDSDPVPLSSADIVRVLIQNPGVLGLSQTPDWLPTNEDILRDALARIPTLDERMQNAELFLAEPGGQPNHHLRIKIFKLRSMMVALRGLPDPPFDSFDSSWDAAAYESYLVDALTFLTWTHAVKYPEDRYVILVRRVIECVLKIRASWSPRDVERLLSRQPLAFRFAACELGRLGYWKDGFLLLEATRGVISSRSFGNLALDSDEIDPISRRVTFVHISNSPRAAYAFVFREGTYFGQEFEGLGGKELTAEFVSLARGGLLVSQDRDQSLATQSAQHISDLLEPIADWVDDYCSDRIVLSLGGYFQSFPIWACGRLGESWLAGRRLISTAPSRAIAIRSASANVAPAALRTLTVHEASAVPGYSDLQWSIHEPDMIRQITQSWLTVSVETATRSGLVASLETADAVHYTGHSSAGLDPHESALITYGDPLTVREILDAAVTSSLVVLASCQSALARNMQRQDEMLSVQTAMFYSGAKCVVGTSWPILDSAGFIFAVKFYEFLTSFREEGDDVSVETVIRACTTALSWMRDASVADVNAVCGRHNAPVVSGNPNHRAFGFYEWAAIGVVGVP